MSDFGPGDIGSVLQGIGALAGAFAVGFAAWLASNSFENWRKQKLSERRMDQAERVLTATYKARRALGLVRNPMLWAHELNAAQEYLEKQDNWGSVDDGRKDRLISAQARYDRLNSVSDERKAIDECLPMARALFGERVEMALETLNRQFHLINVAIDANTWEGNDPEFQRSLREDLSSSSSSDRPNKMNTCIEEQVNAIEEICLPVLRLQGKG